MPGYDEIPHLRALASLLGLNVPDEVDEKVVFALLKDAPGAEEYFRSRIEIPRMPPNVIGFLVPKTRIFFNVERCKQLWGDAMVAAAVFAATQSAPAAFFAATVRKLYDNLALLNEDEAEVVRDFFQLSAGSPYNTPIREEVLQSRFVDSGLSIDAILDELERKGIVTKHRGGLLQLVL